MLFPLTISLSTTKDIMGLDKQTIVDWLFDGRFPRSKYAGTKTTRLDIRDVDDVLGETRRGLALWRTFLLLTGLSTHARDNKLFDEMRALDDARRELVQARLTSYRHYNDYLHAMWGHLGQLKDAYIKIRIENEIKAALACN